MIPLILNRSKGNFSGIDNSWSKVFENLSKGIKTRRPASKSILSSIGLNSKVKGKPISDHLKPLFKIILEATGYDSLEYIPSGRWKDILYTLKKYGKRKSQIVDALGSEGYYLPSLMYALANNYIIAAIEGNVIYVARSPFGDFFVKELSYLLNDLVKKDVLKAKLVLSYIVLPTLIPSYTSIMYILMNDLGVDDAESIAKTLESRALSSRTRYRRMYLSILHEIDGTGFYEKYRAIREKRRYITPSYIGYQLAKYIDTLVDFDTYKKLLVYVSNRRGLPSEPMFKHLFENVDSTRDDVQKIITEHPILTPITSEIEKLRANYERLENEIARLAS